MRMDVPVDPLAGAFGLSNGMSSIVVSKPVRANRVTRRYSPLIAWPLNSWGAIP